jgi:hypothetical protein
MAGNTSKNKLAAQKSFLQYLETRNSNSSTISHKKIYIVFDTQTLEVQFPRGKMDN